MGDSGYGSRKRKWRTSSVQITSSKSTFISTTELHSPYDNINSVNISSKVLIVHLMNYFYVYIFLNILLGLDLFRRRLLIYALNGY